MTSPGAAGMGGTAYRYDSIGRGYSRYRRPDPRIMAVIDDALGDAVSVLDVGSGAGSYEPVDRRVTAVEPSAAMVAQRPAGSAAVVRGVAEHLPFPAGTFDVALAVLTVHHWHDHRAGLRELARVADRQVVLTWLPEVFAHHWLIADYLPEIDEDGRALPTVAAVTEVLEVIAVTPVPIPGDCTDGFCGAYWRRPHLYLDPGARQAISAFAACEPGRVDEAMRQLARDLDSGRWAARHGDLLTRDTADLGYRVLTCSGARP